MTIGAIRRYLKEWVAAVRLALPSDEGPSRGFFSANRSEPS
jgi:hypothetical protein